MSATTTKTIRLACSVCDRDDMDLITGKQLQKAIKAGWKGIHKQQTYHQSAMKSPPAESAFDWWTHLGVCPECVAEGEWY